MDCENILVLGFRNRDLVYRLYSRHLFSYVKLSLQNQIVLFGPVRQQIYGLEETGHFPA